jgi:hypothetical protein
MQARQAGIRAEAWERRLYLPAYQYGEAARLAESTVQAIARWYQGYEARGDGMRPVRPVAYRPALTQGRGAGRWWFGAGAGLPSTSPSQSWRSAPDPQPSAGLLRPAGTPW